MEVLTKGILINGVLDDKITVSVNGANVTEVDAAEITQSEEGTRIDLLDFGNTYEFLHYSNDVEEDDEDSCVCCGCCDECHDDNDWGTSLEDMNLMVLEDLIENVYFNEAKKTTVVKLLTDEVFIVKCGDGDVYDKEVGLKTALLKALVGSGKFNDVVNYWLDVEEKRVKEAKNKANKKNKTSKKN